MVVSLGGWEKKSTMRTAGNAPSGSGLLVPEGDRRFHPGGPDGGIEAAQGPHHGGEENGEGNGFQPDLDPDGPTYGRKEVEEFADQETKEDAEHAAGNAEQGGLQQDHMPDAGGLPSNRPQHADFHRSLKDAHQHGVHHAGETDHHGEKSHRQGHPLDCPAGGVALGCFTGEAGGEPAVQLFDPVADLPATGLVHFGAEAQVDEVDLSGVVAVALHHSERNHDGPGLNHGSALVDAADRELGSEQLEGIAHLLPEDLGGGLAQKNGLLVAVLLHAALHDLEVIPDVALPLPARDQDHGEILDRHEGAQHAAAVLDARKCRDLAGNFL